jgi:hypothetical protein
VNSILGAFAATWLGYFLLLALLPVRYVSPELTPALIILAIYVATSLGFALVLRTVLEGRAIPLAARLHQPPPLSCEEADHLVIGGLLASAIGIVLIAYVRISVQGIDFTQGLAVARELWRNEGEERSGIASPLSIPGYGLGFFFLASTFIAHLHWEQLRPLTRRLLVTSCLLFVAGYSVLTGGRSILLLQLISVLSAGAVRRAQGRLAFPGRFWRMAISGVAVFLATIGYVLYVFSDRAAAGGVTADFYAEGAVAFMGGVPTDGFHGLALLPEPLDSLSYFAVVTGGYVTHSAGTLASVMEYTTHGGVTVFTGAQLLLARLGLLQPVDEDWALSGAFLSLPGAFWYQFGLQGVMAAALVCGGSLAVTSRFVARGVGGGLTVAFAAVSLIVAFASPLIFAPDALAFPFMVLGYFGLTAYSRVRFGRRTWWRVGHACRAVRIEKRLC